ncbi:MAG TPA: MoaD/ThiS family protein [Aquabacterium sp.]|jgi:molybdopterin synthase sulfur carrier subunit|uniref:MoaD/ThiS family protein n=1 Tax=Aquabacterium sp. TaxID=1872578 RepID=UPI002D81A704|nr:MoaD/ThiS family protein [Aquabacterium sp.]HET6788999.1 MoaD/ThiS family protein [Aquabacterium sp.]HEX5374409.1 MoaD/ThiS family protein [Aquabacterium sp.]
MKITVRYFAKVREALGAGEDIDLSTLGEAAPTTVGALRDWLVARSEAHARALGPDQGLRTACDQVMCGPDEPLSPGAEVAFFPPVTGG